MIWLSDFLYFQSENLKPEIYLTSVRTNFSILASDGYRIPDKNTDKQKNNYYLKYTQDP